ncbi:MAG: FixH family protein, partial [Pseudomonadota bacterium]
MTERFQLKGWHVLAALLSFFGTVFAVNAVFVTQAVRTFPGEQVEKSYLQGLEYNKVLEERAAQTALGWTASLDRAEIADGGLRLAVRVTDANGAPVPGLQVNGVLRRPAAAR